MSCGCAERREKISQAAQAALEKVRELFGPTTETEEEHAAED